MNLLKYLLLCISFLSVACNNEKEITSIDDPQLVVVAFFDALYNEKNIKKAASVCDPKLAEIILHYRSPKAVARHMFNMSYDKVEMKPENTGVKIREQFSDFAIVTVYFDGTLNDSRIKDVKRVSLIQDKNNNWLINKILKDPF